MQIQRINRFNRWSKEMRDLTISVTEFDLSGVCDSMMRKIVHAEDVDNSLPGTDYTEPPRRIADTCPVAHCKVIKSVVGHRHVRRSPWWARVRRTNSRYPLVGAGSSDLRQHPVRAAQAVITIVRRARPRRGPQGRNNAPGQSPDDPVTKSWARHRLSVWRSKSREDPVTKVCVARGLADHRSKRKSKGHAGSFDRSFSLFSAASSWPLVSHRSRCSSLM